MAVKRLDAESLSHRCYPEQFQFTTTDDVDDLTGIIGQPRAVAAMRFGMGIRHKGYNLFALGPTGTGKHELVQRYAHEQAATEPLPPDWCYVNNFRDPHKPCKLRLPPARGARLKHDMNQLIEDLHATIPTIFESDEYHNRAREIEEEFSERKENAMQALQDEAEKRHIALIQTPSGFTLAPVRGDSTLSQEEFEKLPEQERKHIIEDTDVLHEQLRKMLQETPRWHKEMRDQMSNLNHEMASSAIKHLIDTLRSEYTELADVIVYFGEVEKDVIENFRNFLRDETEKPGFSLFGMDVGQHSDGEQADNRYRVNDFVTHEVNSGAPVVYEDNPGYNNLLGRVEHRAELGALVTDFTMIRPGALHRANGGYLILDAIKLLTQPYAWEGLKRALQSNEIRIESLAQLMSLVSTVSLEPESIPLDVKVILLGEPHLYYLLSMYDPEFSELFKVAVDFDYRMDRTPESQQLYARFIATLIRQEALQHFDRSAVARVIEHSGRLLGDGKKLLTHTRSLIDLLREADYWARQRTHDTVAADDVQQAIDAGINRLDRIREHVIEEMQRGTLFIATDGEKTGQVNGLSVIDLGKFMFGRPTRITARVRIGDKEVVDIEREVELGGPIHSKGVFILTALLGARYLPDRPLAVSASLVFEQSYSEIEGDSASSAEFYALLSALADAPVKQSLAVTGSVNQHGLIQPIGGVNEKIEGFFDICTLRGLSGDQGVIIPASNTQHLMLREDVQQAVAAGQFAVYAIETVDDGIELLTGIPAGERDSTGQFPEGSINRRVEDTLGQFAEKLQAFAARSSRQNHTQDDAAL